LLLCLHDVLFIELFALLFAIFWVFFYATGPALARLLAVTSRWTTHFRYRDYLPVLVIAVAGFVATAMAGDAFLDIAERVHANAPRLEHMDSEMHAWAATTHSRSATLFFTVLTIIGTPGVLAVIVLLSAALLARRNWTWSTYLVATPAIGGVINLELKLYFARARPELAEALRRAHGYSFPSGHAMGSAVTFGALSYIAFRLLHGWRTRATALAFAATLIVGVSLSRVYLGVHWFSDICAGIAAGLLWVVIATVAYETFRRIRRIRRQGARMMGRPATG
jgi:membrane-associated phospholipid phosphatase